MEPHLGTLGVFLEPSGSPWNLGAYPGPMDSHPRASEACLGLELCKEAHSVAVSHYTGKGHPGAIEVYHGSAEAHLEALELIMELWRLDPEPWRLNQMP
jgi:hypothetical protein